MIYIFQLYVRPAVQRPVLIKNEELNSDEIAPRATELLRQAPHGADMILVKQADDGEEVFRRVIEDSH